MPNVANQTAKHPPRTLVFLLLLIVLSSGFTAYLINFPVRYVLVVTAGALAALIWLLSRPKQTQPQPQSDPDNTIVR